MDQIKPEFLKKLTKFLVVSIWVLSLLVTHHFYVYRFTIELVTHAVDKNYMFLFCNALLVFLAKYSDFIGSSKPIEGITDKTFDYRDFESYNAILEIDCYYSDHGKGAESFLEEEVTVKSLEENAKPKEEEEIEDEELSADKDHEEQFDLREEWINEEEEEEDNVVVMNKKFDEFIRKMKEELRIEAKRHLILV